MPAVTTVRHGHINTFKEENGIGVMSSSQMRDGLSRKTLDAIAELTTKINADNVDVETGFMLIDSLIQCVLPYCNHETKYILQEVHTGWIEVVKDKERQENAKRQSQSTYLDNAVVLDDIETAF